MLTWLCKTYWNLGRKFNFVSDFRPQVGCPKDKAWEPQVQPNKTNQQEHKVDRKKAVTHNKQTKRIKDIRPKAEGVHHSRPHPVGVDTTELKQVLCISRCAGNKDTKAGHAAV